MKQKNFFKIALLAFFFIGNTFGQTELYNQGFEIDLNGYSHTPNQAPSADPGDQYFSRAEPSNTDIYEGSVGPYTNVTGSWLFVGSNPSTINSGNSGILSTGLINVTGYENFELSIDFGAVPNDWDASDELNVEYSWNNTDWSTLYNFVAQGSTNQPLDLANNSTGGNNTANGVTLTYALQTITSTNFIGSGNSLYIRIVCNSGANYEAFGLDNIVLSGTAIPSTTTVNFVGSSETVNENETTFDVCVALTNPDATNATTVEIALGSSTAINGIDYTTISYPETLTFLAGDSTNKCITFTLINDTDIEGDETVVLSLQNVTGGDSASLGSNTTFTLTISDDDSPKIEDFTNSNANSSYTDNSFVGNNGITWNYVASRDQNGDTNGSGINGNALMLRRASDNSRVTSSSISGGIQNFSVKLYKGFTGSGTRQVELFINGVSKGTSVGFDDFLENTFTVNNINTEGNFTIEIRNIQSGQIIIDDITWSSFSPETIAWDGSESSSWMDGDNWSSGTVPTISDNAVIAEVSTNAPIISTNENPSVNSLTITEVDGLNINGGSLTIINDLTINSGSALIITSSFTGTNTVDSGSVILGGTYTSDANQFFYFTETFNDNTSGWSLISSPTVGESIQEFTTFNELQESTVNTNNFGIAPYNNNGTVWNYYTGATDGTTYGTGSNPLNASGNFTSGIGYSVLPDSGLNADTAKGMLGFKGAIATTDFTGGTAISISDNSGSGGNAFNLIGNPYPSFIFAGSDPAAANEFLDTNKDELAEETLWFWDKATSNYITVNKTSNRYIAPAQGFFVKAKTGGGSISFTEAMQSHQSSGTFNKTQNTRPEISLEVVSNNVFKTAKIYYYDNKTTGFDNGFDSSIFEGTEADFSVYTKLVSNETNQKLAIQTLPTQNYDTMVIPVEVNGIVNSEINFSANSLNLPKGYNVYLEDKLNNSITNLDSETYTTTLDESFKENRFFIHTKTSNVLSTENENLQNISIYTTSKANLRISGLKRGKTNVSLFNILGKNVLDRTFEASSIKDISLPSLAKGIYVIKLQNNEGTLTQKIILE